MNKLLLIIGIALMYSCTPEYRAQHKERMLQLEYLNELIETRDKAELRLIVYKLDSIEKSWDALWVDSLGSEY